MLPKQSLAYSLHKLKPTIEIFHYVIKITYFVSGRHFGAPPQAYLLQKSRDMVQYSRVTRPLFFRFICGGGKKGLVWFAVASRLSHLDTFGSVK